MREIKFRAFGNTNFSSEKMYSWEELLQKEYLLLNLIVECSEPHNAWKLMQFTGLHDKNGREIYEGDVIDNGRHRWRILWLDASFWARTIESDRGGIAVYLIAEESEVIGNVHENPELVQP